MSLLIVNNKHVNTYVYQNKLVEAINTFGFSLSEIAKRTEIQTDVLNRLLNGKSIHLPSEQYFKLALFCLSLSAESVCTHYGE